MVSGYDLRINLSYFIGKSYEKEIMNKINETSKEYSGFNVRFFYSEKVNFSIRISSTEYQQINDVCWYQILSKQDYDKFKKELPYSGRWFHTFEKVSKENLLKGINHFESILVYINEPKIIKKQKRNDG